MLTSSQYTEELRIGGVSAAVRLRQDRTLSQRLLTQLGGRFATPEMAMPCGVRWREADEVVQDCLDLIAAALQGKPLGDTPAPLTARIGDWAAEGVALETVQQATHAGSRFVLDQLARRATSADSRTMTVAGQRVAEVLERVTTSFTSTYLQFFVPKRAGSPTPPKRWARP
ncbi:hypothetical protein [Nocardia sp. A7]|uniref:hypothetical protein n=1 Tax=Nocardia sp. A7 TaxID=2789274 RepID=UPI00397ABFB7